LSHFHITLPYECKTIQRAKESRPQQSRQRGRHHAQVLKRENKLGRSQEHFWVVGLNNANKILFIELIGLGRQNRVTANPPDVFRMAIYKLAIRLILVHNHPSGQLLPSTADKAFTDRILKVGEIINIDVLDHLVISETEHLSFADLGIMDKLRASDTWRVIENDQLHVKEWKQKMEKERIEHDKAMSIAKKLKEEGMDEIKIKRITGLKLGDVRKV
jgi:DNA repair protein RadC